MDSQKDNGGVGNAKQGIYAPLREIHGVGPKLAQLFSKKGVDTIEDALYFIPRDYEDRSKLTPINQLKFNESATLKGRVTNVVNTRRGRRSRFQVHLSDGTGTVMLVWFHGSPYLEKDFVRGQWFLICGEVKYFGGLPSITHPDYEAITQDQQGSLPKSANFGRIVPLYSETEGLTQKVIRKIVAAALKRSLDQLTDPLPIALRNRLQVPSLRDSFIRVHFPPEIPDSQGYSPAIKRIIFEEFFVLQLGLGLRKQKHQQVVAKPLNDTAKLESFLKALPFSLTGDQQRALCEVVKDLSKDQAMVRLIQGDVGSGKTVVALAGCVVAAASGSQTALLAPTEVLALQHYKTACLWLRPLGIRVVLLSQAVAEKAKVVSQIAKGEVDLVVGTHAIFQEKVEFRELGLVVVDEQHRFGVEQRNQLLKKGPNVRTPHLLMMTATPIPRTLALTLYGDLDLTLVKEKPIGRKPISTRILRECHRPQLYSRIRSTVTRAEQVYIIYPLVETSEKLDLKSATEMHARLSKEVFPMFKVGLLHGRMKSEEKESVLREFKEGRLQILISTTVIEVGIDVPNATLMVIEHPERLGLSQLHQLRGRVGRGEKNSECLLIADGAIGARLKVMERTEDGFEIAEEDLKIRGPGEFLGTRQSGLPGFRVGHLLKDSELLLLAKIEAETILERDPKLEAPEHQALREMVESRWKEKIQRLRGG